MRLKRQTQPYMFFPIHHFDARSGMKRCSPPGIGASYPNGPVANADFWRDANGRILLRATLRKISYSFEVFQWNGALIPDEQMEDFAWYVSEELIHWVGGRDEEPFDDLEVGKHPNS